MSCEFRLLPKRSGSPHYGCLNIDQGFELIKLKGVETPCMTGMTTGARLPRKAAQRSTRTPFSMDCARV